MLSLTVYHFLRLRGEANWTTNQSHFHFTQKATQSHETKTKTYFKFCKELNYTMVTKIFSMFTIQEILFLIYYKFLMKMSIRKHHWLPTDKRWTLTSKGTLVVTEGVVCTLTLLIFTSVLWPPRKQGPPQTSGGSWLPGTSTFSKPPSTPVCSQSQHHPEIMRNTFTWETEEI